VVFFSLGISLLIFSLRKPPIKDKLLVFMFTGYCSTILGVIIVEKGMLLYPVSLFKNFFDTSPLYEFLLLPLVSIYYYQSTYYSGWIGIAVQGFFYTTVLAITEFLFERYTDLIQYNTWTWLDTFISVFLVLFLVRAIVQFVNNIPT
jgi:membrane-bound metal-dependent hydrolase YbcI (DUF457 family)